MINRSTLLFCFYSTFFSFAQENNQNFESISKGIGYHLIDSTQQNTLICFGGWSTQKAWVENWAQEINKAKSSLQLKEMYAVKGPDDVYYKDDEIALHSLTNHLRSGTINNKIIVLAHSSGSFVAHKFFHDLAENKATELLNKIEYYNLDGAIGSDTPKTTITSNIAGQLHAIYAVYAIEDQSNQRSPNTEEMKKMVLLYPDKVSSIVLRSKNSGCIDPWCVHEILINAVPYNKNGFDLENDYLQLNEEHPVTTQYLQD
ncbi:hypothetical protein [Namhaeicola litoreus]|uniref:Alpha/beta hydrolase n=1 Tax=Namhaeicola litoreus TaxID=1052145 RepID=A0ABW3Y2N1_9FLAO